MEPKETGEADGGVVVTEPDIFRNQICLKTCPAPAAFTLLPSLVQAATSSPVSYLPFLPPLFSA